MKKKSFLFFLHVKFHFGHKKWTYQKSCLNVLKTFSQEFGAKTKNDYQLQKGLEIANFWEKWLFFGKNGEKFVKKSYLKTLMTAISVKYLKMNYFYRLKNAWK